MVKSTLSATLTYSVLQGSCRKNVVAEVSRGAAFAGCAVDGVDCEVGSGFFGLAWVRETGAARCSPESELIPNSFNSLSCPKWRYKSAPNRTAAQQQEDQGRRLWDLVLLGRKMSLVLTAALEPSRPRHPLSAVPGSGHDAQQLSDAKQLLWRAPSYVTVLW